MANRWHPRIDPADPRAPSAVVWAALSEDERRQVVDSLPSEMPKDLLPPPEGDRHRKARERPTQALDAFFRRSGRKVYVSSDLAVYYPDERMFAPDLFAVLDVEPFDREKWVVSAEGRGLDFVLEVVYLGDPRKDLVENVERYARLGIPEYFVYDRRRGRLTGFSLSQGGAYRPLVPQRGLWPSAVLGLDLTLEGERLRFIAGTAFVPELEELAVRAESLLAEAVVRRDELESKLALAEARAAEEKARADRLERETAELHAELERLRRRM